MDKLRVGDLVWTLSPAGKQAGVTAHLTGTPTPDAARVVKEGAHRAVYFLERPGLAMYWKHCRLNGPRAWGREILRGPKAKMEFDRATRLADLGIGTVEPLAWARFNTRWPRGSVIVTRALEGIVSLEEHLTTRPWDNLKERTALTRAFAGFVRTLHDAGVTHPDFHPGNVLIRPDTRAFYLIDVHDLELGEPLTRSQRVDNLVMLNRWFAMRSSRADRARFFLEYDRDLTGAGREIETKTADSNADLWSSRGGRCLRSNRDFARIRGAVSGYRLRTLPDDVSHWLSNAPDEPFTWENACFKDSRSSTVCFFVSGGRHYVWKRFLAPDWTDPFANLVRPSPARRSWVTGHALTDRGVPTPRPLLYLRRGSVEYVLFDDIRRSRNVYHTFDHASRDGRLRLIESLARCLRSMHDRGVSHRDLKADNILVDADGVIHLLDLVGVKVGRRVSEKTRRRDLARLAASFSLSPDATNTDHLRFLRQYLLWGLRGRGEWQMWWRDIAKRVHTKIARNVRRGRPLA